jgi:mycofactocin precursor
MNVKLERQDQPAELSTEDLIEEVSIDGMCGVY